MKRNITKELRSITKEKEDHPKAVRTKNKENSNCTGSFRRPRARGPLRPSAHGPSRELALKPLSPLPHSLLSLPSPGSLP